MQNIKVFIIVIVFVDFPVIFYWIFILFNFFYCLIMAVAYLTPCCYSSNGFDGCIPGCVTLTTHLYMSVALCGLIYIRIFEETAFCIFTWRVQR